LLYDHDVKDLKEKCSLKFRLNLLLELYITVHVCRSAYYQLCQLRMIVLRCLVMPRRR